MSYSFVEFQTIKGQRLELQKVSSEDLESLAEILVSPTTWFSVTRNLKSKENFVNYFQKILERQSRGELIMLVAKYQEKSVAISVYQYPSEGFRRIEIGFSWIADRWQKSFVNSELKLLMLDYAFSKMKASRVEFCVHPNNQKSNQAMLRLGATLEGTFRKWRFLPGLVPDNGNRNIYSIIDDEWAGIKKNIEAKANTYT